MSLSISGVKGALVVFESRRIAGSRAVCSLPAYLNNLRAPSLREIPAILRGESITDAGRTLAFIDEAEYLIKSRTRETMQSIRDRSARLTSKTSILAARVSCLAINAALNVRRVWVVTFHDGAWLKVKASGDIVEAARQIEEQFGAWSSIVSDATTLGSNQSSQGVA